MRSVSTVSAVGRRTAWGSGAAACGTPRTRTPNDYENEARWI
jgi:hypothetical protein